MACCGGRDSRIPHHGLPEYIDDKKLETKHRLRCQKDCTGSILFCGQLLTRCGRRAGSRARYGRGRSAGPTAGVRLYAGFCSSGLLASYEPNLSVSICLSKNH